MKLHHFILVLLAIIAATRFYLIPRFRRKITSAEAGPAIHAAATLALLGWIQGLAQILAISAAGLFCLLTATSWMGGSTSDGISRTIQRLQSWRESAAGLATGWSIAALVLIGIGLAFHAYRRGRIRMSKVVKDLHDAELQRLQKDLQEGRWEEIPPTKDMQEVARLAQERQAVLSQASPRAEAGDHEAKALCTRLSQQIEELRRIWISLDVTRRMNVRLTPGQTELPMPQDWLSRIQTFFFSRGLLACLGRGSRLVYLLALLLLVPSLVGVYGHHVHSTIEGRIVQLDDLRIKLSREDARESWKAAQQQLGPPVAPLTDEDRALLNNLAARFEDGLATNSMFRPLVLDIRTVTAVRSANVRRQILAQFAKADPSSLLTTHESPAKVEADPHRKALLSAVEDVPPGNGPRTPIGREFYQEAESAAQRSPKFLENLRRTAGSFQVPANQMELSHALVRELFSTTAGPDAPSVVRAAAPMDPALRDSMRAALNARRESTLTALVQGTPVENVLSRLAGDDVARPWLPEHQMEQFQSVVRNHFSAYKPDETILDSLSQRPPALDSLPEKGVDLKKARQHVMTSVVGEGGDLERAMMRSEALAEFSDYFPAHSSAAASTTRGELLTEIERLNNNRGPQFGGEAGRGGGGGGGGGFGGGGGGFGGGGGGGSHAQRPSVVKRSSQALFSNSRSFVRLRGFARVGGVLIGQQPTPSANELAVTNLEWTVDGTETRLVLHDKAGRSHRPRSWRTVVVGQALAYAADGRPLAVTMVQAAPLAELKVLTHPALIDTALGYRIVELDRFVDKYSKGRLGELRKDAERTIEAHDGLYRFGWAVRQQTWAPIIRRAAGQISEFAARKRFEEFLQSREEVSRSILNEPQIKLLASLALADAKSITDPAQSPILVKKEFYNPDLASRVAGAASQSMSLTAFIERLQNSFQAEARTLDETTLFKTFMQAFPQHIVWSGVREKAFRLTIEELFPTNQVKQPMVDFMLQIAFTSTPEEGKEESYADSTPWEFPSLKSALHEAVVDAVTANPGDREILADVDEFVQLQRFFRLALGGRLGPDFPVEKLAQLAADVRAAAEPANYRTPRWNARPGALEMSAYRVTTNALAQLPDSHPVRNGLITCTNLLEKYLERMEQLYAAKGVTPEGWENFWTVQSQWDAQWHSVWSDAVAGLKPVRQLLETQSKAVLNASVEDSLALRTIKSLQDNYGVMQLRQSLGVQKDDGEALRRQRFQEGLPPLQTSRLPTNQRAGL